MPNTQQLSTQDRTSSGLSRQLGMPRWLFGCFSGVHGSGFTKSAHSKTSLIAEAPSSLFPSLADDNHSIFWHESPAYTGEGEVATKAMGKFPAGLAKSSAGAAGASCQTSLPSIHELHPCLSAYDVAGSNSSTHWGQPGVVLDSGLTGKSAPGGKPSARDTGARSKPPGRESATQSRAQDWESNSCARSVTPMVVVKGPSTCGGHESAPTQGLPGSGHSSSYATFSRNLSGSGSLTLAPSSGPQVASCAAHILVARINGANNPLALHSLDSSASNTGSDSNLGISVSLATNLVAAAVGNVLPIANPSLFEGSAELLPSAAWRSRLAPKVTTSATSQHLPSAFAGESLPEADADLPSSQQVGIDLASHRSQETTNTAIAGSASAPMHNSWQRTQQQPAGFANPAPASDGSTSHNNSSQPSSMDTTVARMCLSHDGRQSSSEINGASSCPPSCLQLSPNPPSSPTALYPARDYSDGAQAEGPAGARADEKSSSIQPALDNNIPSVPHQLTSVANASELPEGIPSLYSDGLWLEPSMGMRSSELPARPSAKDFGNGGYELLDISLGMRPCYPLGQHSSSGAPPTAAAGYDGQTAVPAGDAAAPLGPPSHLLPTGPPGGWMAPDVPSIDSVQLSYAIAASLCPSNASGAAKPSGFSGDKGDCDHKAVGSGAGHSFEAGEKCDPHALLSLVTAQESVAGPGDQIDLQPPSTSHLLATFPGGFLDTSNSDMPSVLSSAQRTSSAMQAWQTVLQHLASSGLAGEPAEPPLGTPPRSNSLSSRGGRSQSVSNHDFQRLSSRSAPSLPDQPSVTLRTSMPDRPGSGGGASEGCVPRVRSFSRLRQSSLDARPHKAGNSSGGYPTATHAPTSPLQHRQHKRYSLGHPSTRSREQGVILPVGVKHGASSSCTYLRVVSTGSQAALHSAAPNSPRAARVHWASSLGDGQDMAPSSPQKHQPAYGNGLMPVIGDQPRHFMMGGGSSSRAQSLPLPALEGTNASSSRRFDWLDVMPTIGSRDASGDGEQAEQQGTPGDTTSSTDVQHLIAQGAQLFKQLRQPLPTYEHQATLPVHMSAGNALADDATLWALMPELGTGPSTTPVPGGASPTDSLLITTALVGERGVTPSDLESEHECEPAAALSMAMQVVHACALDMGDDDGGDSYSDKAEYRG